MIKIMLLTLSLILAGSLNAKSNETKEAKEIVTSFFKMAFTDRMPTEAALKYISEKEYTQHNPSGKDGRDGFINGFGTYIKKSNYTGYIKRVIAENDLVVVHAHGFTNPKNPEDKGEAVVDIYRVEEGKIVEHWDVIQAVPLKSKNTNTMF